MGGGGTEARDHSQGMRGYAEIASAPLPSRKIPTMQGLGNSARVSSMAVGSLPQTSFSQHQHSQEGEGRGYILPPLDSKYDRALARHFALKYPTSSPVDQDVNSQDWIDGHTSVQSSLSQTQPFFRPKTPSCPWGVDRKIFLPGDSVVSRIRLATTKSALDSTLRSHTSMEVYPPKKGMLPSRAFERQYGQVVPQVIPGYTGHFTGFREAVGKTYGHAELMLGRMSPALVPMYHKEDVKGDELGICRSGYPTFVKPTHRWTRRPDTAMRPLIKNPNFREPDQDTIKRLSNMLVERVPGS